MFTPGGQLDRLTFAGVRGGGGSKGSAPATPIYNQAPAPAPTYADPVSGRTYTTPDDLNAGITEREKQAKIDSDNKIAADKQAVIDKHNTWLTTRDTAVNNERATLEKSYRDAGVDPANYKAEIDNAINAGTSKIVDDDPNVASVFSPTLGADIVNTSTGNYRTAQQGAYDKIFDPNYSSTHLADTLASPYVNSTISGQFDPLAGQLTAAHLRGTLSDTGYDAANTLLGTKKTAGTAAVQSLGSGILKTDRGALDDYIGTGRDTASTLKLGQAFDPTTYQTGAEGKIKGYTDTLGGDILNAVGGTKYADINELMNAGGAAQGGVNPNLGTGKDASLGASILDDDKKRGLGSTGAF
jgi:hypothetical protein